MRMLLLAACFVLTCSTLPAQAVPRPNVLFLLADDLGWGDLSCHGSTFIKTPPAELAQLNFDRWCVEVNLRHLKQTMRLDVLRCRSEAGVRKKICMLALGLPIVTTSTIIQHP